MSDKKSQFKKGGKFNRKKSPSGSNSQQKPAQNKKKTLEDYVFYVGSSKQASDYEVAVEYIINHVKLTFDRGNDIAETLRNLKLEDVDKWKPKLRRSVSQDAETAALENEQLKIEFTRELDEFVKRNRVYQDNQYKAYSLLWDRCAKSMQNKLASRTDDRLSVQNLQQSDQYAQGH